MRFRLGGLSRASTTFGAAMALLSCGGGASPGTTPPKGDAGGASDGPGGSVTHYDTSDLPAIQPGQYDPRAFGQADLSKLIFPAFSQVVTDGQDAQVLALAPDLLPRAWARWDTWGLKPGDYKFAFVRACVAQGTLFMGGTTASVLFQDEVSAADFSDQVSRDASGQPVPHGEIAANAYRATLANPAYQQRLVDIGKIQLDGGVDGLHYDEILGGYTGANWVGGNEGFDDYHVADFGAYLCAKYAGSSSALAALGVAADDHLDCTGQSGGRGFDYRGYLARHGAQSNPLSSARNPLAADWGTSVNNRPNPSSGTFLETYPALVYWQRIVVALRTYARQTYGREILISANGTFPFVDFQTIGLYDGNRDGPGNTEVNWVPRQGADLDGTRSFKTALEGFKARSKQIVDAVGGHEVPIVLFLDWPTSSMDRYYGLTPQGRQDYFRLYGAEVWALGMLFAPPLATTTDSNTATALGMMGFFQQLETYYRNHAAIYLGAQELADVATVSASNLTTVLASLPDGGTVLHLINHNYAAGVVTQPGVTASFPVASQPSSVTLASPDFAADKTVPVAYNAGTVTVDVGDLGAYVAVVVR